MILAQVEGRLLRIPVEVLTGQEGLEQLEAGVFDLLVTDVEMPGASGFDLLDAARARAEPPAVIILATGSSQFEFLESLITKTVDWSSVTAFHLDEYIGMSPHHPASFRKYLCDRVFTQVKLKEHHLIQGDCDNPQDECRRISSVFDRCRVDVAFIGIGENGHIAFNDPPASFDDTVSYKVVQLDEKCRQQQFTEGWFETIDSVPKFAITMSIPAIMRSGAIVCTVPDARKAAAVRDTLSLPVSPIIPASILRTHGHATLLLDRPAASLWKTA